ncbi:hypothetical protein [Ectopseudomonas oleovorans]|uniref:Antitoxin FitA-like ribbon-helix-helix domain-containing protein n=1 Tax=Ectopseudomonas oleovorans TaxID=301 RepID=A0A3D9EG75_ECTOL|nr:hypothetical protein [Pseudomonas oleovorans]RED02022.1 hypothetical protein DFO60_3647 [Pseudomonas oleovorans]
MFNNDTATGKLNIRSLPIDVLSALTNLAAQNDRSLEAEARHALKAWVKPPMAKQNDVTRLHQIANRLQFLAGELEKACPSRRASFSRIAEALGLTHAVSVEQWFLGQAEPSFDELLSIAKLAGCRAEWLVHGEGTPFRSKQERIPEHAILGTEFLFSANSSGLRPKLHLVRSKNDEGSFLFVRQYSDWDYQVFETPYHVSEVIGAGGEASLASLSLVLNGVYNALIQRAGTSVTGYLARKEVFSALLEGERHPAYLLKSAEKSCWWEDFWDAGVFGQHNYWDGWRSITARINGVVESSSALKEQRAELRSHAFF